MARCVGCHVDIGRNYYLCSFTCAALTGYFSVREGWIKDTTELRDFKVRNRFYKKHPVRERRKPWL